MAETSQKTVYVGGFSNDTNAQLIHAAFVPFGDIVDIQLPPDPAHQAPHRGFAFVSYSNADSAHDAIDNMNRNVLPGPSNAAKVLKVNMAKPPKGLKMGGSNRAIWTDEAWLQEHGQEAVLAKGLGADLASAAKEDA